MEKEERQDALIQLLEQAEAKGYITFDNIIDCADVHSLAIQDFDWLTDAIATRGIIIYDKAPVSGEINDNKDDLYDDFAQSDYGDVFSRIIELNGSLSSFVKGIQRIIPPQRGEFNVLKYQVLEGNIHARERMIEMHMRLALKLALQRTEMYGLDIQDTVSEALIGLVIAVDKYNPDENGSFSSYASMWMVQNMSRNQECLQQLVYYPVHKKNIYLAAFPILKMYGFIDYPIKEELNEIYDVLRKKLQLTDKQIDDVLDMATQLYSFETFYRSDYSFREERWMYYFGDDEIEDRMSIPEKLIQLSDAEQIVEEKMLKETIWSVLSELTEKERKVVIMRYGLDDGREKTLEEIGACFGVTRERIRQIESKAMRKLRYPSRSRLLEDFL